MRKPFKIAGNEDRITQILSEIQHQGGPEGLIIRPIRSEVDHSSILKMDRNEEELPSYFGVQNEHADDALTLVAEIDGKIIGQMSSVLYIGENTEEVDIELWVDGVFVVPGRRGEGVGKCLGAATMEIVNDYRLGLSVEAGLSEDGLIFPEGHTEEGSGGEALIDWMCFYKLQREATHEGACPAP